MYAKWILLLCALVCQRGRAESGTCNYNGTIYESYDSFKIDVCTTGFCDNGQVLEDEEQCPYLSCEDPHSVEGQCCSQCPDDHVPFCEDNKGNKYKPGEKLSQSDDPCESCTCSSDGRVMCSLQDQDCIRPYCEDNEELIADPGECCPYCHRVK